MMPILKRAKKNLIKLDLLTLQTEGEQVLDTIAPTILITSDVSLLSTDETASITFVLSEPSTDFTDSDVSVSGGTLSGFEGSDMLYSAMFTPNAESVEDGIITVLSGAFSDAAGNVNAAGASMSMTVDTTTVVEPETEERSYLSLNGASYVRPAAKLEWAGVFSIKLVGKFPAGGFTIGNNLAPNRLSVEDDGEVSLRASYAQSYGALLDTSWIGDDNIHTLEFVRDESGDITVYVDDVAVTEIMSNGNAFSIMDLFESTTATPYLNGYIESFHTTGLTTTTYTTGEAQWMFDENTTEDSYVFTDEIAGYVAQGYNMAPEDFSTTMPGGVS